MSDDPRARLETILTTVTATIDDDVTPATIIVIYRGGPETYRHLFYTVNADVVLAIERHRETESGDGKRIQDIPIRYDAMIEFWASAVDKTGLTATKVLNKICLSVQTQIEATAQTADYTWRVNRDEGSNQRIGGLDPLWQDHYVIEQRPMT